MDAEERLKELWGCACTTAVQALNKADALPGDLLPPAAHLIYEQSLEAELRSLLARATALARAAETVNHAIETQKAVLPGLSSIGPRQRCAALYLKAFIEELESALKPFRE